MLAIAQTSLWNLWQDHSYILTMIWIIQIEPEGSNNLQTGLQNSLFSFNFQFGIECDTFYQNFQKKVITTSKIVYTLTAPLFMRYTTLVVQHKTNCT